MRDLVATRSHRGDEEDDECVETRIAEQERYDLRVMRRGCRAEHVDRVGDARLGRQELAQRRLRLGRRRGKLEPARLACVRAENAQAACIREHTDPTTVRQWLRCKQRRHVEKLLERLRPQHSGLTKQRIDGGIRPRQRSGVRTRGTRARTRRPALQCEDRLRAGDAPSDTRELARIAERLEIEQDEIRAVVGLPPFQEVVRRNVRLVADRDEGREPESASRSGLEHREAERAALGREADVPGRNRPGGKGRVQAHGGRRDPETIGAEQPRSVCSHKREQFLLPSAPLRS